MATNMETLTIKDWRSQKARKVRVASYTRAGTAKPFSFKEWYRKAVVTLAIALIIMSSYVSTYEAGKVSMFTHTDWENITEFSFIMIDKIIPIPFTTRAEAMESPVVKNGKTMTLGAVCSEATKSNNPLSGDLATYCS